MYGPLKREDRIESARPVVRSNQGDAMEALENKATEETQEELELEIASAERALAVRYEIRGTNVRRELLRRLKTGEVKEEPAVVHWLALYATLVGRLRSDRPPMSLRDIGEKEAASGGLFFCPDVC